MRHNKFILLITFFLILMSVTGCSNSTKLNNTPTEDTKKPTETASVNQNSVLDMSDYTEKVSDIKALKYTLPTDGLVDGYEDESKYFPETGCVVVTDDTIYYTLEFYEEMAQFPTSGSYVVKYERASGNASVIYQSESNYMINKMRFAGDSLYWVMNSVFGEWKIMRCDSQDTVSVLSASDSNKVYSGDTTFDVALNYVLWNEFKETNLFCTNVYSIKTGKQISFDQNVIDINSPYFLPDINEDKILLPKNYTTGVVTVYDLSSETEIKEVRLGNKIAYAYLINDNTIAWGTDYSYSDIFIYDITTETSQKISSSPGDYRLFSAKGNIVILDKPKKLDAEERGCLIINPISKQIIKMSIPYPYTLFNVHNDYIYYADGNEVYVVDISDVISN